MAKEFAFYPTMPPTNQMRPRLFRRSGIIGYRSDKPEAMLGGRRNENTEIACYTDRPPRSFNVNTAGVMPDRFGVAPKFFNCPRTSGWRFAHAPDQGRTGLNAKGLPGKPREICIAEIVSNRSEVEESHVQP